MKKYTKLSFSIFTALTVQIGFAFSTFANSETAATATKAEKVVEHEEKFIIYHKSEPNSTLGVPPQRPKLLSPAPLSEVTGSEVVLKWNPSEEADSYSLQVSDDANFFKFTINEPSISKTEFTATGLQKDKIYYWRVAAIKSQNNTGFTKSLYNRSSFTVK